MPWHRFKPGQRVPLEEIVTACEQRIRSGAVSNPAEKRRRLEKIRDCGHPILVFAPFGDVWGRSPMNPNAWQTPEGGMIWTPETVVRYTPETTTPRGNAAHGDGESLLSPRSSADPEQVCRRLVPQQYWDDVMGALGKSIELAHQHGPDRWGVRVEPNSIMLKVGPHEVLQIGTWEFPFHLIIDKNVVPYQLRSHPELQFSGDKDYYGHTGTEGYYPSNPGSEACDMPFESIKPAYQDLLRAHTQVIARAATRPKHPSTRITHSPELIRFVAKELGKPLLQPAYVDGSDPDFSLLTAEELPRDEQFSEGAARQILVNAYERDRRARQRCIDHYGARCYVCGMSFEEQYGPEAAGIIHVHHIVPLAEIGEQYKVDPIKDLRPICPNCHMVIHATRPTRTVEQVVKMIRGG